jgi:hypothetical protein
LRSLDSTTRAFRRTTLALSCALALGACTAWVETPPPAPSPLNEISGPIRIIRDDGFAVVLHDPYVRGDTLYGYPPGTRTRMAVALKDVRTTRRREFDPLRGFGALAVGAVVAFGLYAFGTFVPVGGN